MVSYAFGVILMIVGLLVSVALHEVGHLVPAKKFGAIVSRYFVGFGPTLWSTMRKGTEYGIKAVLLGGYVSILGMYRPGCPTDRGYRLGRRRLTLAAADAMEPEEREALKPTMAQEAREASREELERWEGAGKPFYELPAWQKIVVMLGGPVMNLVLAVVFMAIALCAIGYQAPTTTLASVSPCVTTAKQCRPGDSPGPAGAAGLRAGDTITSWGGTRVETWNEVKAAIAAGGDKAAEVGYVRNGVERSVMVQPVLVNGVPVAGVSAKLAHHRGGVQELGEALWQTASGTAGIIVRLPQTLWQTVTDMVTGTPRDANSVMSVVGIARVSGEITSSDAPSVSLADRAGSLLSLVASLNMALFIFNLIPLLPLDGGHIVSALFEGGRRAIARMRGLPDPGPADTARMMPLVVVVWGLLAIMTVILILADIINPLHLL